MMITGKNLIGNNISGENNNAFSVSLKTNDEEKQYSFYEATPSEIAMAVELAAKAFQTYRNETGETKATLLDTIATAIGEAKDSLVAVAMQETALPQPRLDGEVMRTVNQLKMFAALLREGSWVKAVIDTALPDRKPLPKPDIRQMQVALGPVAVFGASNFPFAFSVGGGDTASALAAGCPVVCKAHPAHPATSEMVAQIIVDAVKKCNLPEGTFSMIQGRSNECSIQLITHPLISAVAFTGSFGGGKALFDAAAARPVPIPVYAEMGSVNPVFILPEIMQEQAASLGEKLAASNLMSVGQFCTNPGLIFSVKGAQTEQFLTSFANTIEQSAPGTMLTENICINYHKGTGNLSGKTSLTLRSSGKEGANGRTAQAKMFQTTAKDFLTNKDFSHEVFGPSSIHIIADSLDELKDIAASLDGQLTASIWANEKDADAAKGFMQALELKAGRVIYNNVPTGVEVTHAMIHGGPYPATTDSRTTSVGTGAIYRFTRPVAYQGFPPAMLPDALADENRLNIFRLINGEVTKANMI